MSESPAVMYWQQAINLIVQAEIALMKAQEWSKSSAPSDMVSDLTILKNKARKLMEEEDA